MVQVHDDLSCSYIVVMRASAAARFPQEYGSLEVENFPSTAGPISIKFRTRYSEEGFGSPIPREMWVEARGAAPSIKDAINTFTESANGLAVVVAFSANAHVGDLEPHVAFDNTPGRTEREFFESFLPDERGLPKMGRRTDIPSTGALVLAIANSREQERLLRAMGQYRQALTHWRPGTESLALAHLYMGVEALTPAVLRKIRDQTGKSNQELAEGWGIELKQLDSEVRRRLIFREDTTTFQKARAASDGLEHGFKPFPEIHSLASQVRDSTAAYLREAILDMIPLDEQVKTVLLSSPFDRV